MCVCACVCICACMCVYMCVCVCVCIVCMCVCVSRCNARNFVDTNIFQATAPRVAVTSSCPSVQL